MVGPPLQMWLTFTTLMLLKVFTSARAFETLVMVFSAVVLGLAERSQKDKPISWLVNATIFLFSAKEEKKWSQRPLSIHLRGGEKRKLSLIRPHSEEEGKRAEMVSGRLKKLIFFL